MNDCGFIDRLTTSLFGKKQKQELSYPLHFDLKAINFYGEKLQVLVAKSDLHGESENVDVYFNPKLYRFRLTKITVPRKLLEDV